MGAIHFSVPMRRQGPNPICWIACLAMIASFKRSASVGIGSLTGGYDPSNSSIPDPVRGWNDFYNRLASFGFVSENPSVSPSADYIEDLLRRHGPFMLTHLARGFAYGPQWAGQQFQPNSSHAVVITGIDTVQGTVTFNNPWGDVNQSAPVNGILQSMVALFAQPSGGIRSVAYIRSPTVRHYAVQTGDTLSRIAGRYYGDFSNWRAIYEVNQDVIGNNPDLIRPGQRLLIPG